LFKFYYSSIIILFILLFKNSEILIQLNLNYILFFILLFIFIISILLSNYFILFIFKLYLNIKYCIQALNSINFNPIKVFNLSSLTKPVLFSQSYYSRSFSTYINNKNINDFENNNLDQDNISYNSDNSIKKQLKEFKKAYSGGYLGYKNVFYLGTVVYDSKIKHCFTITNFGNKIIEYLNEIPEDVIYSVLPFIRWHDSKGNYRTLSISKSIKINKNTSRKLIANKIEQELNETLKTYELANKTMDIYLMSRP
jgi:hypothetical protein